MRGYLIGILLRGGSSLKRPLYINYSKAPVVGRGIKAPVFAWPPTVPSRSCPQNSSFKIIMKKPMSDRSFPP